VKTLLRRVRRTVSKYAAQALAEPSPPPPLPTDFSESDKALCEFVRPFTMTGPERVIYLARAVEYVIRNGIPGAFVECGVWRGGSMMCVAHTLLRLGVSDRNLFLFDTFEGMPPPEHVDRLYDGTPAINVLAVSEKDSLYWAYAGLEEVKRNMRRTRYPAERIHYVRGRVEDTIPGQAPDTIALLRLDTDWYSSTHHELVHLYPRLHVNGVAVIDDYGWWRGSQKAVDEYFTTLKCPPLLHRIDETARGCVKN
jgi:hypothetical protein